MAGMNDPGSTISAAANDFLCIPVSDLKGVGPKRAELLANKGINTVLDLFYFIPKGYEDRSKTILFNEVEDGKPAYVKGEVVWAERRNSSATEKSFIKL